MSNIALLTFDYTKDAIWTIGAKKVGRKKPGQDSIFETRPKVKKFPLGSKNHLPRLAKFSGARNVLLDSYDDSLETPTTFVLFKPCRELNFGIRPLFCSRR